MNPAHEREYRAASAAAVSAERENIHRERSRQEDWSRSSHEKSSADLERDIERTRNRIEVHAQKLEDTLAPGHLIEQALGRLRGGGADAFLSNLGRDVRDNPIPLLLTGVGIAWLVRNDAARRRGSGMYGTHEGYGERAGHSMSESLRHGAERAREGAQHLREGAQHMKERASEVGASIGDAARAGRERVLGASHKVGEGVDRVRDGWNRMLDEQPLLLGLIGLAAGAAIAASFPSTESEDEWMGEASDDVKQRAARRGHEIASEARRFVEEKASGDGPERPSNGDGDEHRNSGSDAGGQPSHASSSTGGSASSGGGTVGFPPQGRGPGASSPGATGRSDQDRPAQGGSPFGHSKRDHGE